MNDESLAQYVGKRVKITLETGDILNGTLQRTPGHVYRTSRCRYEVFTFEKHPEIDPTHYAFETAMVQHIEVVSR